MRCVLLLFFAFTLMTLSFAATAKDDAMNAVAEKYAHLVLKQNLKLGNWGRV